MKNKKDKIKSPKWQLGLALFTRISSLIIGPVIGAVVLIWWLNRRYDIGLGMILGIIVIVVVFSFFSIFREAKKGMKKNN
jgi:hypothetical protein